MEILVIDDDSVSRIAIAQTLQSEGYRVTTAGNGFEGLEYLMSHNLQLVVCDWSMPKLSGQLLCQSIRQTIVGRYIYILMVTGNKSPDAMLSALRAGADDYIAKPFNPAELILRVNTGRRIIRSESRGLTLFSLAKLAESRDPETGLHLDRVRSYSRVLAQSLRTHPDFRTVIDDDFIALIQETSPLHDIGKVAIPDSILLKPGRLTDDEFEVMKTHTIHGANTLQAAMLEFPNAEFLHMAHDIALAHHERFDGTGYPHRMVGDAIPLTARIVALADVYDALTSKRVYKPAMTHAAARNIILEESGKHFDPRIVSAFIGMEGSFKQLCHELSDSLGVVLSDCELVSSNATKIRALPRLDGACGQVYPVKGALPRA